MNNVIKQKIYNKITELAYFKHAIDKNNLANC